MTRRTCYALATILFLRTLLPMAASAQPNHPPTVAIADVDVRPGGWTLPPPQLGSTIAALLVEQLVSATQLRVLDGQWLVPESESGAHLRLDRLRAAAEERQVDYLVLGTVTGFGTEQRAKRGGLLLPLHVLFGGGLSRRQMRTTLTLNVRIVDVRSGEVVTTATGEGVGRRSSVGLGVLAITHSLPLAAAASSAVTGSRDGMLNAAAQQAVTIAARGILAGTSKLTHHE